MKIFPAIDLLSGKAVRLVHGDYNRVTVFSENPAELACDMAKQGAKYLHVVDLDGARDGSTANFQTISDIIAASDMKIEVGGGIRSHETAEKYLSLGVMRIILGSAAVTDTDFCRDMIKRYGDKVAVGVDISDGRVAIHGWKELSAYTLDEFCSMLDLWGADTVICTDISRDGAMRGTNTELYRRLTDTYKMKIIASGGVTDIGDIQKLVKTGVDGAICGRAVYDGRLTIPDALEAAGK